MNEKDYQRKKNKFLPKIHAWYEHLETFLLILVCVHADMTYTFFAFIWKFVSTFKSESHVAASFRILNANFLLRSRLEIYGFWAPYSSICGQQYFRVQNVENAWLSLLACFHIIVAFAFSNFQVFVMLFFTIILASVFLCNFNF